MQTCVQTPTTALQKPAGPDKPTSLVVLDPQYPPYFFGTEEWEMLRFQTRPLHDRALSAQEALADIARLEKVNILFSGWGGLVLDSATLALMPRLRAVFFAGGSVRSCMSDAFWARSIPLVTAGSANARPVAEYTLAALVFGLKGFLVQAQAMRDGKRWEQGWDRGGCYRTTVGLVSFGTIARSVRTMLASFDLTVIVYDPYLSSREASNHGVEKVATLEELFSRSNAVSLHTPLLPETVGLIRKEHLLRMPRHGALVNSSRGAVVEEAGLIEALRERPDLFALVDVTTIEPAPLDSPLRSLPNVFLTPHVAGSIGTECRRMTHLLLKELDSFLAGHPLRFEVREADMATMA